MMDDIVLVISIYCLSTDGKFAPGSDEFVGSVAPPVVDSGDDISWSF